MQSKKKKKEKKKQSKSFMCTTYSTLYKCTFNELLISLLSFILIFFKQLLFLNYLKLNLCEQI